MFNIGKMDYIAFAPPAGGRRCFQESLASYFAGPVLVEDNGLGIETQQFNTLL